MTTEEVPSLLGDPVPSTEDDSQDDTSSLPTLDIPVTFTGETHVFHLPADAVLDDLTIACRGRWGAEASKDEGGSSGAPSDYDWSAHKFIGPPPIGLLKSAADHDRPLAPLFGKQSSAGASTRRPLTLRLMASRISDVQALRAVDVTMRRLDARLAQARQRQARARPSRRAAQPSTPYTFQQVRPLPHLPNPGRSLAFLQRLCDDVGIRHAMNAHKFSVGLLTEMDPALFTTATHEGTSRTLGLNRNQGQIVELRLRTDAGDGYRDYRTVRRTLCHELAHNVHGPHDQHFWALCHQLEREVERADYHGSGRTLAGDVAVAPPPDYSSYDAAGNNGQGHDQDYTDAGGWTGGTFVLGGGTATTAAAAAVAAAPGPSTGTAAARRSLVAHAAEERARRLAEMRQQQEQARGSGSNGGSSSRNSSNRHDRDGSGEDPSQ